MTLRKERDMSLDLIRALAGWLVVSVHFFLKICYYYEPLQGGWMLLMSVLRMACMTCVPLFLMLTGYLCCEKKLSGRYYLGLARVGITYLLASGACILFRWLWLGEPMSLKIAARMILDFSGTATGWYIEMYIGLFLLIPFLNMLWQGAESEKNRRWLVLTLAALTALPGLTNQLHHILPQWWDNLYPLCYYFIGAYFYTYQPQPRWGRLLAGFAGASALGGVAVFWLYHGQLFQSGVFTEWAGPTVMVASCCLFLLLRQVPCGSWPRWSQWIIGKGAELSLGIYLVGWCFDKIYHEAIWPIEPTVVGRLKWYFILAPAVYLSSALVAQLMEWARRGITWCINKACPQAKLK